MAGTRFRIEAKAKHTTAKDVTFVQLVPLGKVGSCDMRIVRLISRERLDATEAAKAVSKAVKFAKQFNADLLVTPGGFGVAKCQRPYHEKEAIKASEGFISKFLQLVPVSRSFDMIIGVDVIGVDDNGVAVNEDYGLLQDSYFIPKSASAVSQCARAWKSYPRSDEESWLLTKGTACPRRTVDTGEWRISMLVCNDMVAFSGRSRANIRVGQRRDWAEQLSSEVFRGPGTCVVHLIHWLDNSLREGKVFVNGMRNLVDDGVVGGISTFNTKLRSNSKDLKKHRERTAEFASPTLDLYVQTK